MCLREEPESIDGDAVGQPAVEPPAVEVRQDRIDRRRLNGTSVKIFERALEALFFREPAEALEQLVQFALLAQVPDPDLVQFAQRAGRVHRRQGLTRQGFQIFHLVPDYQFRRAWQGRQQKRGRSGELLPRPDSSPVRAVAGSCEKG